MSFTSRCENAATRLSINRPLSFLPTAWDQLIAMASQDGGPEIEQIYDELCDTIDRAKSIPTSLATPAEALLQVIHTSCQNIAGASR